MLFLTSANNASREKFRNARKFLQYKATMGQVKEKPDRMEGSHESAGRSLSGVRARQAWRRRREESPGSTGHGGG